MGSKANSHSHGHSHGHGHGNDLSNALKASVLPVGTTTPGSNTAKSLATAPGTAPSTVPKPAVSAQGGVNKVIVVFKDGTPLSEIENAVNDVQAQGGKITHRYESALLGFSAEIPDSSVQTLNVHPHVDYVEADGEVSIYTKNLLAK
ncbi:hypothetical protein BGX28_007937 [Mortierella sp. GBA30]|nr:hypothetical protein BGX28_007937 [Mortierella sp. GBA30]